MVDEGHIRGEPPERERQLRFEATLHRGKRHVNLEEIPALGLDRVPDPTGEMRVLITMNEAARLVEMGFEVHLLHAHATRPLDRALIPEDEAVQAWLEERLEGTERKGES